DLYRDAYGGEPFVVVTEQSPSTKAAYGSNTAHITARFDNRSGWIVALCAIDNLVKGGSGQAVQCANLALGLPEWSGLPTIGVYPGAFPPPPASPPRACTVASRRAARPTSRWSLRLPGNRCRPPRCSLRTSPPPRQYRFRVSTSWRHKAAPLRSF